MKRWVWGLFFIISLSIHASLWYAYHQYRESQKAEMKTIPLFSSRIISQSELDAMVESRRSVVESDALEADPSRQERANYLSDKTRRVDKETIARGDGDGGGALRRGVRRELDLKPKIGLPKLEPDPDLKMGSSGVVNYGVGGPAGSDDLVKSDIAVGAETLLNTDEYRFASFFNRIKDEIVPRWKPAIRKITRMHQQKLPEGVYLTDVMVGTDRDGNITMVEVTRSSGYSAFDEAATDAFWHLAKFHNLPREFLSREQNYRTSFSFSVQFTKQGLSFDTASDNDEKRWAQDDRKNR